MKECWFVGVLEIIRVFNMVAMLLFYRAVLRARE